MSWLTFELRECPHSPRCSITFTEDGQATSATGPCLGLSRGRPIRHAKPMREGAPNPPWTPAMSRPVLP